MCQARVSEALIIIPIKYNTVICMSAVCSKFGTRDLKRLSRYSNYKIVHYVKYGASHLLSEGELVFKLVTLN